MPSSIGPSICIGLMSGTSLDAIDAAACEFDANGGWLRLLSSTTQAYPAALRHELLQLQRRPDHPITVRDLVRLDAKVGDCFADAALQLLAQSGLSASQITAIGSHGQTVFHDPLRLRSSLQLGDPNRIAVRTGIATVADLRRADLALGGQGAPLVPAFHRAVFTGATARAVINIGGIANITVLPAGDHAAVFGFDTGPGNALLDDWIQQQRELSCDIDGAWARSGSVHQPLLQACLSDPYFQLPSPKSTGRDYFNLDWLAARRGMLAVDAVDVQATLLELSAVSIAQALEQAAPATSEVFVCGGGARNGWLMQRLQALLAPRSVTSTTALGLDPAWVEAAAFAWLAWQRLRGQPGNLPAVTGASRAAILGGLYAP